MKSKKIICFLSVIGIVFLMVFISEILNEKEIIFPEIAAIASGMIISPKIMWNVSKKKMLLNITICAIVGFLISTFLPFSQILKLAIAFFICQIIFIFSKTTFAPMISAGTLPVLIETKSIIYPISAFSLTALIILVVTILEKGKIKLEEKYAPISFPKKEDYISLILREFFATIIIILTFCFNIKYAIAPPLLVAFTEFSKPTCKARNKPVKSVILIFLCALSAAISRLIISEFLNLKVAISTAIAMIFVVILMNNFKMYLPPAAALAILPMIIKSEYLYTYPLQILLGATFFMIISLIFFNNKNIISHNKS